MVLGGGGVGGRCDAMRCSKKVTRHVIYLYACISRGKLQDPLVAEKEGGLYQAEKALMISLLEALAAKTGKGGKLQAELLEGDWELVRAAWRLLCMSLEGGG